MTIQSMVPRRPGTPLATDIEVSKARQDNHGHIDSADIFTSNHMARSSPISGWRLGSGGRSAKFTLKTGTYKNLCRVTPAADRLSRPASPCSPWARRPSASAAADSLHPNLWPQGSHSARLADSDAFVDRLLARMTLEEKVGQMIQADIASITPDDLRTYPLGSVLAGGNAAPGSDVRCSPKAWLQLTEAYHRAALAAAVTGHAPIPLLFGIDAVHGNAKLIGATIFPHNVGLGAAHDPQLIYRIGRATAEEVSAAGIDWTFAPTVAVARDVRWGRSYESYSESPALVARYAPADGGWTAGAPRHGRFHVARPHLVVGQTLRRRRCNVGRPRPGRCANPGGRTARPARGGLSAGHRGGCDDRDGVLQQLERRQSCTATITC